MASVPTSPARTTAVHTASNPAAPTLPPNSRTPTPNSSFNTVLSANISDTPPADTNETSLAPTPPSNQSNLTSLPITHLNTSPPATTEANTTTPEPTAKPTPECSYSVTPIQGGFHINMTFQNVPTGSQYSISIKEEGQPATVKWFSISDQTSNQSEQIKHLKPCTEYEHRAELVDSDGKTTLCNNSDIKTGTTHMTKDHIIVTNGQPGSVCYQSHWDISSSLSKPTNVPDVQFDKGTICFNLTDEYFCSDFTVNFTPENCVNSSFNITKYIPVDFIDFSGIDQQGPTGLPAEIKPKLPSNCENLTVDYTCSGKMTDNNCVSSEKGRDNIKITELEPFTEYSCTGLIKNNSVFIKKTTPPVLFTIVCDLTTTITKSHATNTSTELRLETTSSNCQDLSKLHNLSYVSNDCRCEGTSPTPPGGTCYRTGLTPYTVNTCEVHLTYNNIRVNGDKSFNWRTEPGTPGDISELRVIHLENNAIRVTCKKPKKGFFGPEEKYSAHLLGGSTQTKSICEFDFKDLSYLATYTVQVVADNGHLKSKPETKEFRTSYNDKALIGFLVFLIILTSVALLVVVYKIYILKRRKSHDLSENIGLIQTGNDEENLLPIEPIGSEVLLETYKRKLADEGRLFLAEFQSIPRIFSRYTVKEAKKACNVPKNRYVDILPYDYNRVQLTTGNGEAGCDYINASYIDGYKEPKKYIAAQGPKDETVSDFWRMVWEQQSSIIVMVTRCEEGNRIKCAQYWPSRDRETEIFEEFIVKLTSENHYPDYIIRHLSLTNKREKNSEREVTHIQFMSWPDHGVPGEPHLLLKLRRRVNAFKNFFSGPIVVHCSAGVGRTGTYIGIDAMMEGLEAEGRVDIYGYVVRLRRQRCLMVQVEAQYILIHQALLEHNQFGETEISLSELHSTLSTLKQKNSETEPSLMEEEFERLPSFKNWRTFNTGMSEENKKKNRSSTVIPYDYNRVLLKLDEGQSQDSQDPDEQDEEESSDEEDENSTKYINASHIDGYWSPHTFIVAQTPLSDTLGDFWSMIYQKKACTIVMLSDCSEADKDNNSVYWDKEKKTFGEIEVEVTNTETSAVFITRNMLIRHVKRKENRQVKHFQFLKWESKQLPEKPRDLTDMIKDIQHSCESSKSQSGIPIVVHCDNGSTRSGIFCALWNLLDSADSEKLVDVFQVVKTLRKERQCMISSLEHYQFLYNTLESTFPVQNGEVKQVQAAAVDSVQIVNETKEQTAEGEAEQPASTTSSNQQAVEESTPLVVNGDKEEVKDKPEKESSAPTETTPLEDTSNGPTVTAEV
ncbi:receptor-type tyrosine-protein phosphatase C [Leuresthes tenuis]|uniref:receptor-type tyrosine-protein phosphatase C n=1 Tax=Leuresthes tenuis TaxID=355514 RepID=UPI003B50A8C7